MPHDAISFHQDKAEGGRGLLQISFLEEILALLSNRSLNAIVAQSKNCPFGVNTTIELKHIETTSHKNGIWRGMFRLRGVSVLSDVVVTSLSSLIVLTSNGNFWILPLLHSVSEMTLLLYAFHYYRLSGLFGNLTF
jgi:hypothetical protein